MEVMFKYDLAKFIPFRDIDACERVRTITRKDLTRHPNPEFRIRIEDDPRQFYFDFALDLVNRILEAEYDERQCVVILPVGPMPQYEYAVKLINSMGVYMRHLHVFNMDEYADQDGNTAPPDWPGSFQRAMRDNFYRK